MNGEANSSNDDEFIAIRPGKRIPLIPRHMTKLHADVQVTKKFVVNMGVVGTSSFYTGGQLGPAGFTLEGNYVARPFPAVNGEFPVRNSTFYAPGAPRGLWGGIRFRF